MLIKNINDLSFNKKAEVKKKNIYNADSFENLDYNFDIVFLDPPFKDKKIMMLLNNLSKSNIINSDTLLIIHRNKKELDQFDENFKIIRKENYGSSKIIFGILIIE